MKKLIELLKSNFAIIPDSFSDLELVFLSEFFHIKREEIFDEKREKFKQFYVLEKKEKYLPCHNLF
jgi:hypothetical protein